MDKKMMVCNFIVAIGNIINGILGFTVVEEDLAYL